LSRPRRTRLENERPCARRCFPFGRGLLAPELQREGTSDLRLNEREVMDCPSCGYRLGARSMIEVPAREHWRLFSGRMFCRNCDAEVAYTTQSVFLFAGL